MIWSIVIIEVIVFIALFTALVKLLVLNDPVRGIFFYPKEIRRRVFEMGLTRKEEAKRRKIIFFTGLSIGIVVFPILFIGVWSGISDFKTAFIQAIVFWEAMNWYDGIVVDEIWVRFSKFRIIKGAEDLPHVKKLSFVLAERLIMSAVYIPVTAGIAKLAVVL